MKDPLDELLELDRALGVFELLRRHTSPSRLFEVDRRVRLVAAIERRWKPEEDDTQGMLAFEANDGRDSESRQDRAELLLSADP
jgi:hypothetical protein